MEAARFWMQAQSRIRSEQPAGVAARLEHPPALEFRQSQLSGGAGQLSPGSNRMRQGSLASIGLNYPNRGKMRLFFCDS